MAWVSYQRVHRGSGISGKVGESLRIVERWQIRVDSPATTKASILTGVSGTIGVTWGSSHPEFSSLKAMEFDLSPETEDGMRWILAVTYYVPPRPIVNGIPDPVWERLGGVTTIPVYSDANADTITNAAGDPLEGLEKEREEVTWALTKCYTTDAAYNSAVNNYAGKVNSTTWATCGAKTVKCYHRGAKKVRISKLDNTANADMLEYIESRWEFVYDPLNWKLKPQDVGFHEIVSGSRKAIVGSDGKPVRQPVALNANGTKKADGVSPSVIKNGAGVDVYLSADWSSEFGTPVFIA